MNLDIQGKVALITGGSKGIGFATAKLLAAEGAQVAIVARREAELSMAAEDIYQHTGVRILTIQGDVSVEADCQRVVDSVAKHYGRLDIVVNNAGSAAGKPFEEMETSVWEADLDLKLYGAIQCAKAAIPYLQQSGQGAIVNVTSIGGKAPGASSMPSSVSRAAGLALTKAMSKDLAKFHIRVNAVCIGGIRSEQLERGWQKTAPELTWEQYARDPRHQIPLGRIGHADEAANVIVFLVSGAASYVTGTAVNIDGGKSEVL
jgi:3-oxoacyl-[acyl-carrier protein] reductase